MSRAYYSSVFDHPAADVWGLVRDFNNYPRYIEGVTDCRIEDGKNGDEVGAVRRFEYRGRWIRQRLEAHSDAERSFTYGGLEPMPFPAKDGVTSPAPIDYRGTLRLAPVVDGDRTFLEWWIEFEGSPDEALSWIACLSQLLAEWTGSLSRALDEQP